MKTSIGQIGGSEWEDFCQKILKLRYVDYQKVPATFGGDLGVEGFTFSGLVFQCYCPDEEPSGKELYEKQRDKITRDISKLIKNSDSISGLGASTIKEWHFLTPRYENRELLNHCRNKEIEVKQKNLPKIHNDFSIMLKTEEDFIVEIQQLVSIGINKVHSFIQDQPSDELDKLLNSDNSIVKNIKRKLGKLNIPQKQQDSLTKQLVNGYLIGRYELEALNKKFPSTFKSLIQLKSATENQLEIRTLAGSDNRGGIMKAILDDYQGKVDKDFSSQLASSLISNLSTEAISDWLGRCPLDFPDKEQTNG